MAFAHAGALGGPSEWLGPVTHVLAETVTCVLSPHRGAEELRAGEGAGIRNRSVRLMCREVMV